MKIFLLLLPFLIGTVANAQVTKNTHIDTAGTVNIYGNGKVVIGKAIVQQTLETKVLLLNSEQKKDSTGIYTTVIELGNKEKLPLFGVNLLLQFSDSVISVDRGGDGMSIGTTLSNDHKQFIYKAGQINRSPFGDTMIMFQIKSKNKIVFTIHGIQGVLK